MLDRTAIENVRRDEMDLRRLLEERGAKFKGNMTRCPFHDDKSPSAGIYRDEKTGVWKFKCHGGACGKQGDYFDVKSWMTGRPVETLISETNPRQTQIAVSHAPQEPSFSSAKALSLALEGANKVEGRWEYWNASKSLLLLLVFRVKRGDGKSFLQASPRSYGWVMKGVEGMNPLYNLPKIEFANNVVVTEGEKAADAAERMGLVSTTSPGGAQNAGRADWSPLAGKNVTIWRDNDAAGLKYQQEVERILVHLDPPAFVGTVDPSAYGIPEKGDAYDFEQMLLRDGATDEEIALAAQDIIQSAKRKDGTEHYSGFVNAVLDGKFKLIHFPLPSLTRLSKALRPGTVTMLCGYAGTSKSFFAIQCLRFWREKGIKCACYMFEDDMSTHIGRAIAQELGQHGATDPDWVESNPREALILAEKTGELQKWLSNVLYVESRKDHVPDFEEVAKWTREKAAQGCRAIIIDPVSAIPPKGNNRANEDRTFIFSIKDIAIEYGASIILTTHPVKNVERHTSAGAMMGGAAYERFSQNILFFDSLDEKQKTRVVTSSGEMDVNANRVIHIAKSRHGRGTGAAIAYHFDPQTLCFVEQGLVVKLPTKKKG